MEGGRSTAGGGDGANITKIALFYNTNYNKDNTVYLMQTDRQDYA